MRIADDIFFSCLILSASARALGGAVCCVAVAAALRAEKPPIGVWQAPNSGLHSRQLRRIDISLLPVIVSFLTCGVHLTYMAI